LRSKGQCAVFPGDLPFRCFVGGSVFQLRALTFTFLQRLRLCLLASAGSTSGFHFAGFWSHFCASLIFVQSFLLVLFTPEHTSTRKTSQHQKIFKTNLHTCTLSGFISSFLLWLFYFLTVYTHRLGLYKIYVGYAMRNIIKYM